MNIIVVGSGGREHAICWKLAQSSVIDKIVVVPGNGGTANESKCVNINPKDCDYIEEGANPYVAIAKHENCRMAVIGPEDPLADGIADDFWKADIPCVGPKSAGAQLEASKDLPKKLFAYTPCYRSEAGSYRTEERGMIRGYQFDKVEMVQYTKPEDSDAAFEELVAKAEGLVKGLGLHYQVSKLAAGDISHSMARTYDIEVYLPSVGIYKEVSSASNARDYQARRTMCRYRDSATGKTRYVHTLNASGLATSRIFPAILEQNQQPDGSVKIPEVLQPFMGGLKVLKPIK